MTQEDRQWLDEHKNFLYVSTHMTKEEKQHLYDIYNRLTGENKKPNGCGRCVRTTLNIIKHHYEKTGSKD
jgi:hypothetical protein